MIIIIIITVIIVIIIIIINIRQWMPADGEVRAAVAESDRVRAVGGITSEREREREREGERERDLWWEMSSFK